MSKSSKLISHIEKGKIGFPTTLASSVGVIMASPVILTVTSGFGIGGDTFALAVLLSFIMMQAQLTTFSEAAAILPTSGSVYDYISCGMGRFWAITGSLSAYLIVHVFAGTAETILSGVMALVNFESLNTVMGNSNTSWMVGVGLVIIFGLLNAFGIEAFSKVEIILTFSMWSTLVIFSVCGLLMPFHTSVDGWFGQALNISEPTTVLSLIGMAMFMFVGCELVTPMAPEIKNSARVIPRAMAIGLCGVAFCMFMYGAAMTHQVENIIVDPENNISLLETPMAIPAFAGQVMGDFGKYWIGIGLLLAGAATINTLMAAVPRILYGMALDGALPRVFAYLHPRFKTPVFGILVAVLIPCVHAFAIQGDLSRIIPLVLAAVCSWGTAYLLVTISVILLRIRRPDLHRAYKSPFFPLPQIISSAGIILAIVYITPPGMNKADVYIPFVMMLGLTACYALIWTIFVQKINPFRPVDVESVLSKTFSETELKEVQLEPLRNLD
ncbi:APC family permease [Xenorhabdus szentirmaii]|uniref:APC family amino acid permease n=2 Tax=Xenorhabdus szentirmaii TaxID=290112 RepID=W1J1G9_9GAMM|nr:MULTISPECIES: APC family permease [Xenorhabdus]MBD2779546.1 APC family permease [Xenorhabdus sp. 38]MBD2801261.1 APC family permease [Xenorhabdus sp. M]MBD2825148.1 APC family permease [Xenorhabdus sp. 5]PHM33777.1 amino acid transporter [Xenorhabdus szentirmaii DSM 16338]PHM42514.1 amino acid transporter [Xenorhabdus szentirmaii]